MEATRLPVRILALAFASWLPTQEPASGGPPAPQQRLVYELPLDAMQRSLRAAPERTIHQLLDEALPVHADQKLGPIAAGKLRWIVHRIRVDPAAPDRWQLPLGAREQTQSACEPLYAEADYDSGQVPARFRERPHAELIELVALDLHQRGFDQHDLDPLRIDCGQSDWGPCLNYSMQPNATKDYADWSEQNVGHTSVILWNDELVAAPTFQSRIPGSGRIFGPFTEADVARMAKALRSGALPAAPKFLRQEPVTTDR